MDVRIYGGSINCLRRWERGSDTRGKEKDVRKRKRARCDCLQPLTATGA